MKMGVLGFSVVVESVQPVFYLTHSGNTAHDRLIGNRFEENAVLVFG